MSTLTCSCGVALNVAGIAAGKSVRCPKCQQVLTVPGAAPAVPTATAVPTSSYGGSGAGQQKLKCPCGQVLGIKLSMAGKQVKCPYCQKLLQVPGGPAAPAAQPAPAARPAPAQPTPANTGGFPSQGGGMFDNVPASQPMAGGASPGFGNLPPTGAAAPMGSGGYYNPPGMPMSASGGAMGGRSSRSSGGGINASVLILAGLAVCVVASVVSFFLPPLGLILGVLIFLGAAGLSTVGSIWILILAFEDDTTEGLLVLFVPFYYFYYLIKTWDGSAPYIISSLSLAMLGGGIATIGASVAGALVFATMT